MDLQLVLDAASRFLHVGTAVVLVGGTCFMRFVLHPIAMQLAQESREQLLSGVIGRWKRFVHGGIGLFVLSGFYNYFRLMGQHRGDKLWHMLVGTKILLAFLIFFLVSALIGRSKTFEGMRQQRPKWMAIIFVLAMLVIAISSFVKVRGVPSGPVEDVSYNQSRVVHMS